ncbi:MAG: luciferase family protein [Akkermansiaceae bacterium]
MKLRERFEEGLGELADVDVGLWKDTDLMCVFYRGKEFAHFHDHEEIDVRLSQKFIKQEGIRPLVDSPYHLKRSKNSRWVQMRFQTVEEVDDLVVLIQRLIDVEYKDSHWGG